MVWDQLGKGWSCADCISQKKCQERNCKAKPVLVYDESEPDGFRIEAQGDVSNPGYRETLRFGDGPKEMFITQVCPVRLKPEKYSRCMTYIMMSKNYRMAPWEVDMLKPYELQFYMMSASAESTAHKISMPKTSAPANPKGMKLQ